MTAQGNAVEIPVQNLPTGPVVFMSGGIGLRYVEAGQVERLREALEQIRDYATTADALPDDGYLDAERMQEIAREALDA